MRVLVTGHNGYIGCVLVPLLIDAGHEVVGADNYMFEVCTFGPGVRDVEALPKDIRDLTIRELEGFDAVVHLAAISNDPLGNLAPEITDEINHQASVRLAGLARTAGVSRFVYSSSCSLYGAAGDNSLDEQAPFNPVTPYGVSKVAAEAGIRSLADDRFSPTFLRNATAYGVSARLRIDLVLNNLVAFAVTTGEVLMKSDGTPIRPLVHVEDISRAFVAVLDAPRSIVHAQAFNVGRSHENYRIRDVARIVEDIVPGSRIRFAEGASPDARNYRVNCEKISRALPSYQPTWTVPLGAEELFRAYRAYGLRAEDVTGSRYSRIGHIEGLQAAGAVDRQLRWRLGSAPQQPLPAGRRT